MFDARIELQRVVHLRDALGFTGELCRPIVLRLCLDTALQRHFPFVGDNFALVRIHRGVRRESLLYSRDDCGVSGVLVRAARIRGPGSAGRMVAHRAVAGVRRRRARRRPEGQCRDDHH
jgi:hypothetical protein